jgi:hypothetical protein
MIKNYTAIASYLLFPSRTQTGTFLISRTSASPSIRLSQQPIVGHVDSPSRETLPGGCGIEPGGQADTPRN